MSDDNNVNLEIVYERERKWESEREKNPLNEVKRKIKLINKWNQK